MERVHSGGRTSQAVADGKAIASHSATRRLYNRDLRDVKQSSTFRTISAVDNGERQRAKFETLFTRARQASSPFSVISTVCLGTPLAPMDFA